jgi:hypothetical protein
MKSVKRGTPRRRPKRKPVEKRKVVLTPKVKAGLRTVRVLAEAVEEKIMRQAQPAATLTVEPLYATGFVGTLKLKAEQIAALRRPVEDLELEWRPVVDGGPAIIPYLGHNGYRDRLDAAFGLGAWGMAQVGKEQQHGKTMVAPFALIIDGLPRYHATGECRWDPDKERQQMSYGDALEGCKSNAIVRCGKDLGIARELWSKSHVADLQAKRGGPVNGTSEPRREPPPVIHAKVEEPITDQAWRRLWVLIKNAGREDEDVRLWLKRRYGLDSTKAIKRRDYDAICREVEAEGPLVLQVREPGSDDE